MTRICMMVAMLVALSACGTIQDVGRDITSAMQGSNAGSNSDPSPCYSAQLRHSGAVGTASRRATEIALPHF